MARQDQPIAPLVLPAHIADALRRLFHAGFAAFLVGGAVREWLLGHQPVDFDLASPARPEQIQEIFSAFNLSLNGLHHGTIRVLYREGPIEITTFRSDGPYSDHRRPDRVNFTDSLTTDLARRDFTINAMAWQPALSQLQQPGDHPILWRQTELIDPYGGRQDLNRRLIRAVGDPYRRFSEDALRILRALRFAARLDFSLDPATSEALNKLAPTLRQIAVERIWQELRQLLCGRAAARMLEEGWAAIVTIIPELERIAGFDPCNLHQPGDLRDHTLRVLAAVPPEPALRLAALLHDIGKPLTVTPDCNDTGQFPGHQELGAEIAATVCARLKMDQKTARQVVQLVRCQSSEPDLCKRSVRRWLSRHGVVFAGKLLTLMRADSQANAGASASLRDQRLAEISRLAHQVLREAPCLELSSLDLNGRDLLHAFPDRRAGRWIGHILRTLHAHVLDGDLPNQKAALLSAARLILQDPAELDSD